MCYIHLIKNKLFKESFVECKSFSKYICVQIDQGSCIELYALGEFGFIKKERCIHAVMKCKFTIT